MHIVQDFVFGLVLILSGAAAKVMWTAQDSPTTFHEAILGPLGALALAVVMLVILWRYLESERKEAKEANAKRIELLNKRIDQLQAENSRLWQERHNPPR